MYSLWLTCAPEAVEMALADLWDADTAGVREIPAGDRITLIAGFETNDQREALLKLFSDCDCQWKQEDATDWVEATHRAWPPRQVGERFFLTPPWCVNETPAGRIRLIHNPGLACGTGEHPCTQLALESLERTVSPGQFVADVGTGSGMLAIGALQLGAKSAIGIDLDAAALQAAIENAALNGQAPLFVAGSADCLKEECADVTVANISATVLVAIADELLRITRSGGTLILTGFTENESAAIEAMFPNGEISACGEWRCVQARVS